jgi:hypothetical protein
MGRGGDTFRLCASLNFYFLNSPSMCLPRNTLPMIITLDTLDMLADPDASLTVVLCCRQCAVRSALSRQPFGGEPGPYADTRPRFPKRSRRTLPESAAAA